MEINPFILALSKTLPESCLQGLIVYLVLQLLFWSSEKSTASLKFNLYYTANLCLFAGFVLTFFHHFQQIVNTSFSNKILQSSIKSEIQTIFIKPNLWLQFNFWTSHHAYLISGLYLVGLLFGILKLSIGLININWFKNNKNLKLDTYLSNISSKLSSNFRLIKTVSVFVSDQISVPLTFGFIKPIIVFPIALINRLSAQQTEAILLHELAHIKRNDYLLNMLLCIVRSFLFFNPAVWLMEREINKYREQCCDDLVLDNTLHKLAYAHALLLIEEYRSTQLTLTLASNGKKYTLLNRIKRITNMKTNEPLPQKKLVVLLLALITIGISVAWNLPHKKSNTLTKLKIEVIKPDGFKYAISADKAEMIKQNKKGTLKIVSNKFKFQPDNKLSKNYTITGNNLEFIPSKDTVIQSKNRFKIVMEDSIGNKKEYNSINDLPKADQKEFLKQYWKEDQSGGLKYYNLQMDTNEIASIKKYYNSPEWKKQMADIKKQGEDIRKQFNSPQWKKQMADIRKQGEDLRKQFNSPQWKKQIEKSIDSARTNWKNSKDFQLLPAMPEKLNQLEKL